MNDEPIPPSEEKTTVEAEAQAEATAETQKIMPALTPERVTDITLGLGKAAVDALDKAARQLDDSVRQLRQDAPGFLAEMEEKGRPVREKLTESIKTFRITDPFGRSNPSGDAPTGDPAAFDDIEALENRVRELEQQVSGEPTPAAATTPAPAPTTASPFSMLELDDEPPAAPAVAEPETVAAVEPEEAPAPKKPAARRTKKKADEEPSAA